LYFISHNITGMANSAHNMGERCKKEDHKIIEVTVHILNKGSSILVAKNVRLILKTICTGNTPSRYEDDRKLDRLKFPTLLSKDLTKKQKNKESEPFTLVPHDTFISHIRFKGHSKYNDFDQRQLKFPFSIIRYLKNDQIF